MTSLEQRLEHLGWEVPEEAIRTLEVPGRGTLTALRLPPQMLEFGPELGYWCHLKVLRERLALLISSFRLANGPGDWAIPLQYKPRNENEALIQDLGFDEGWENSAPGPLVWLELTPGMRDALRYVTESGSLGLTVVGGTSIYPMTLQPGQIEDLTSALLLL